MFIEDGNRNTAGLPPRTGERSARQVLQACHAEATLIASGLCQLDQTVGAALCGSSLHVLSAELQAVDRLRQEMEGLARVLGLLAGAATMESRITSDSVAACTLLAAARPRFLGSGVDQAGGGMRRPLPRTPAAKE